MVCIVVSNSLIPGPEMIGTTDLIVFLQIQLLVSLNALFLTMNRPDRPTGMMSLPGFD